MQRYRSRIGSYTFEIIGRALLMKGVSNRLEVCPTLFESVSN